MRHDSPYIVPALILSLAILAHAFITKPVPIHPPVSASKGDFAKATREILASAVVCSDDRSVFKGVDIDEVRFSPDGTMVLVEYTVRLQGKTISSDIIFEGDPFGRYSGSGTFKGIPFATSVK